MYKALLRACLFLAPLAFAGGLALMQPQIAALLSLDGQNQFLRSLAMEPTAWRDSHILLSLGALLYIGAGLDIASIMGAKNRLFGGLIGICLVAGFAGLMGNFALDFVYSALATGLDEASAAEARSAILRDPMGQILFTQLAPMLMLAGMVILALTALITNWVPRLTGILILGGWGIVIGLNAILPMAEVIGHLVIGSGFWLAGIKAED